MALIIIVRILGGSAFATMGSTVDTEIRRRIRVSRPIIGTRVRPAETNATLR